MPSIAAFYEKFRDDTNIVFLVDDVDADVRRSKAFLEKKGLQLPLAYPGAAIPQRLFTGTLPTSVVLDKRGHIVMKEESAADYGSTRFEQFIRQLRDQ